MADDTLGMARSQPVEYPPDSPHWTFRMAMNDSLMRRLTIVRHLFQLGVEQSFRGEPLAGLAILPLHDAVELFLQAALEHAGGSGSKDFLSYWPALGAKGVSLEGVEGMKRFNRARVSLKHDGTLPAHVHIEDFRGVVSQFLHENFPKAFGRSFDDISLAGLVKAEPIRNLLVGAEEAIRNQDSRKAMENVAVAFRLALSEYLYGKRGDQVSPRLYHPGPRSMPFFLSHALSDLGGTGEKITKALEGMSREFGEAITVIAYNLDFDGYRYLKTYSPVVHELVGGNTVIDWMRRDEGIDEEIVKRCLSFVTDAALRLEGS